MATDRLHLRDSFLLGFKATVVRNDVFEGKPCVVLDRTAFYAEAGGQQADRGVLWAHDRDARVVDVQINAEGEVQHLLEKDAYPRFHVGETITGIVNREWRRDQMSQHTAQHMLSRAFRDRGGYETVSARLGSELSTVDLNSPPLSQEMITAVEDAVNEAVLEDREIRVLFPSADELRQMALHTLPKVEKDIRIIEVDGFDAMPCGGTHCSRTGQVGPVRVVGQEKYKGLTRVTFVAGRRAIARARADDALLREVSAALTCARTELPVVAERMKADVKTLSQTLGSTRAELMTHIATELLVKHPIDGSGTTVIATLRDCADVDALRALVSALTKRTDVVALVASKDAGTGDWIVVAERGATAKFEAGRWFKAATQLHGGRGGGRPEHAEGRFPGTVEWSVLSTSASAT